MATTINNDPLHNTKVQGSSTGATTQNTASTQVGSVGRASVFKDDDREPKDVVTLSVSAQKHVQLINQTLRHAIRSGITSATEAREYVYKSIADAKKGA